MPIRTHRGRAAVYRRLWGWPLRSPKHLVITVVVLAVAATVIGYVMPKPAPSANRRPSGEVTSPGRQEVPTGPAPSTTAAPPTFSVPRTPPPQAPADPAGLSTAETWAKQWATHPPGINSAQWTQQLRPYTTDEFITVMASVDPANVPATRVTGPPTPMDATASSIDVRLPTDGGDIQVLVTNTPQGWRVAGYDKVG